jgi:hypothetical protein
MARASITPERDFDVMQTDKDDKHSAAYHAAWVSLRHEQELHLQRRVYDHPEFRSALVRPALTSPTGWAELRQGSSRELVVPHQYAMYFNFVLGHSV